MRGLARRAVLVLAVLGPTVPARADETLDRRLADMGFAMTISTDGRDCQIDATLRMDKLRDGVPKLRDWGMLGGARDAADAAAHPAKLGVGFAILATELDLPAVYAAHPDIDRCFCWQYLVTPGESGPERRETAFIYTVDRALVTTTDWHGMTMDRFVETVRRFAFNPAVVRRLAEER